MEAAKLYHQYPGEYEEWIDLKDGAVIFLRPIKPTDGPLIRDLFQELSPQTIYFRFLTRLDRLKPELLKHLVEIDYETHFTLVALIEEGGKSSIIGTCRFISTMKKDHAEFTVTLRDDWQRRGLGKIMATRVLNIARLKGIADIEIAFDYRNEGVKRLFASLGYPVMYESCPIDIADRMEIHIKGIVI